MRTKLPKYFIGGGEVSGFAFKQVFENGIGYVYRVKTEQGIHYEAFRKKEVPICIDFTKRIYSETVTKEVYPKSRDFGKWAWNAKSYEDAVIRLRPEKFMIDRADES